MADSFPVGRRRPPSRAAAGAVLLLALAGCSVPARPPGVFASRQIDLTAKGLRVCTWRPAGTYGTMRDGEFVQCKWADLSDEQIVAECRRRLQYWLGERPSTVGFRLLCGLLNREVGDVSELVLLEALSETRQSHKYSDDDYGFLVLAKGSAGMAAWTNASCEYRILYRHTARRLDVDPAAAEQFLAEMRATTRTLPKVLIAPRTKALPMAVVHYFQWTGGRMTRWWQSVVYGDVERLLVRAKQPGEDRDVLAAMRDGKYRGPAPDPGRQWAPGDDTSSIFDDYDPNEPATPWRDVVFPVGRSAALWPIVARYARIVHGLWDCTVGEPDNLLDPDDSGGRGIFDNPNDPPAETGGGKK